MSDKHDPRTNPFEGGRDIPEAEWERLSMFLDGDLPDDDAHQLERDLDGDPALKAALADLKQVSVVLRTVERAPAGFADRVLAAVENEPIPANNAGWSLGGRWLSGLVVAAAAAVVLFFALPKGGGDDTEAAAAKIDLQAIVAGVPDEQPQVAPKAEIAASKGAAEPVKRVGAPKPAASEKPGGTADPVVEDAPAPEVAVAPALSEGTAEAPVKPEPYGVARALQYQVPHASPMELANLAAMFGGGLQDASGSVLGLDALEGDTSGVVYLSIPSNRMSEFDQYMRKLGKKTAAPSDELLTGGKPLRVEIVVENLR